MKFEILSGNHFDENGKHAKGAIVETWENLVEIFGAKFRRRQDLEDAVEPTPEPEIPAERKRARRKSRKEQEARDNAAVPSN